MAKGTSHQPERIVPIPFFSQRVCMNGLLITQHADIISISLALFFSIGISGLQSKGGKTVKVVGALHNERAVNYIPR